jgi:hypothetical protein
MILDSIIKTSLEDGKQEITIKDERQNIISWAIQLNF